MDVIKSLYSKLANNIVMIPYYYLWCFEQLAFWSFLGKIGINFPTFFSNTMINADIVCESYSVFQCIHTQWAVTPMKLLCFVLHMSAVVHTWSWSLRLSLILRRRALLADEIVLPSARRDINLKWGFMSGNRKTIWNS